MGVPVRLLLGDDEMTNDNTKGVMDGVEPAAIRTFDGEGDYSLRVYEDNETYLQEFEERNPRHVGWVDYLYTADQFAEREAALLERIMELEETCAYDGAILRKIGHLLRYIDGTKYSGTYDVGVKAIMDERDQLRLQLAALLEGLEAGPTFAEAEPQALKLLGEAIAGQAKEIVSVSQQLA